jgi:hypothetical protein
VFKPKPVPKAESRLALSALQDARKMSLRAARDMERIWSQPGRGRALLDRRRSAWLANPNFVRWFGRAELTAQQIGVVRDRLRKIDNRLHKKLTIHIHRQVGGDCERSTWAYHTSGRHVHLCPFFFSRPRAQFHEQATTLIHELAHGLGLFGKGHPGRSEGRLAARKLAGSQPRKARKNPWNLEMFYLEYA